MHFTSKIRTWVVSAVLLSVPLAAHAEWAKFSRDGSVQTMDLTENALIESSHRGYDVTADASAILSNVDFTKLTQASIDFDHWAQMGMPGVEEMHTVKRIAPNQSLVWIYMTSNGTSTRHYQNVVVSPQIGFPIAEAAERHAFGNTFELTHPASRYKLPSGQILSDSPSFSVFRGSWYLEPMSGNRVYVRYYVDATVASGIPSMFVGPIAERSMTDGIRQMIQILANQARLR